MARIRSVHPGLATQQEFTACSRDARLLLILLWCECDDQGTFEWKPTQIRNRVMPCDTDVLINGLLDELIANGFLLHYTIDGKHYGACHDFQMQQSPKRPRAVHPTTAEARRFVGYAEDDAEPIKDEGGGGLPLPLFPDEAAKPSLKIVKNTPQGRALCGTSPPHDPNMRGQDKEREREREKEKKKERATHGATSAPPPSPEFQSPRKGTLWREGVPIAERLTGMPNDKVRDMLGKLLNILGEDVGALMGILRRAEAKQPMHARSWLYGQAQIAKPGRKSVTDQLREDWDLPPLQWHYPRPAEDGDVPDARRLLH